MKPDPPFIIEKDVRDNPEDNSWLSNEKQRETVKVAGVAWCNEWMFSHMWDYIESMERALEQTHENYCEGIFDVYGRHASQCLLYEVEGNV